MQRHTQRHTDSKIHITVTINIVYASVPTQLVEDLFPNNGCTCKYVRKECCQAAVLVGGKRLE